jgi:hypothetical protein
MNLPLHHISIEVHIVDQEQEQEHVKECLATEESTAWGDCFFLQEP